MGWLYVAAAKRLGGIRGAGDVCGSSARTNLVDEVSVLCLLAQLEVSSKQLTIARLKFVTKLLNGVLIDEGAGCFAFSVDCVGYIAKAAAHIKTHGVNVAVSLAATIFHVVAKFGDTSLCAVETIFQATIKGVKTIAETIGDTAQLTIYVLAIEAFKKIGAGDGTLDCGVVRAAISKNASATKYSKPYQVNKPFVMKWPFPPLLFMSP